MVVLLNLKVNLHHPRPAAAPIGAVVVVVVIIAVQMPRAGFIAKDRPYRKPPTRFNWRGQWRETVVL